MSRAPKFIATPEEPYLDEGLSPSEPNSQGQFSYSSVMGWDGDEHYRLK